MWEISNNNQIVTFLLSLALGGLFCLSYDVIRAFRKIGLNSALAVNISDVLLWIIYAFVTFIFLIARTNGEIRGYVLCGQLIGFVLVRISLSRILFKLLSHLFIKTATVKRKIDEQFYIFFEKAQKWLLKRLKYMLEIFKSVKKFLKNAVVLLYNKINIVDKKRSLDETKT